MPSLLDKLISPTGREVSKKDLARLMRFDKHAGPGDHPSGSPQSVHGGGRGAPALALAHRSVLDGIGDSKKRDFLNQDGRLEWMSSGRERDMTIAGRDVTVRIYSVGEDWDEARIAEELDLGTKLDDLETAFEVVPDELWEAAGNPKIVIVMNDTRLAAVRAPTRAEDLYGEGLYIMPTDELDDKFADIYDKWTHYPDGQDTLYLSLQSTIPGEFVIPVDRLTHNIIHELSHAVTMPTIYNGGFVTIMDLKGAVLSSTDAIDSLIEGVPDPWEYATAMGNPSEFIAEAMTFEVLGQTDVMFGAYAAAPELEGYLDSFFDGDVPRAADKQLVGQLAFEKALARMLLCGTAQFPVQVDKHYGPGDHPSGSPQSVHGARLLRPVSGDSEALGKTYLVNPDGSSPNVSMDGLAELKVDKAGKVRKIPNATSSTIVTRIDETLAVYDMTRESMGENMQLVFDSAMARYEDHPELFEADKFYERWHEELFIISELHNRGFDDVIAAAAAISPGLDAAENLQYANELAQLVDDNHLFTPTEAGEIAAELADNADMIRNPVYTDKHEEVKLGLKQEGELRAPETGEARLAIASSLEKDVILLQSDGVKFLSLSNEGSARAAHWMRRQTFFNEAGDPVGFQTKSWSNFANAIEVLREDRLFTADDALRGIKTRSFYNNIVDPTNNFRRDDVTVDFHTINISAFGLGSDDNTHIQATPGLESVGLGIRPAVADAIRNVNTRGRVLHGSRVQEITWAEWRRGQGPRGSDTWTSYGGTVFELKDISSDPRKKT